MRILSSSVDHLPVVITSAFVVESAARYGDASVAQLLDPQSAMNHLLSHGKSILDRLYCYVSLRCVVLQ